MRIRTVFAWAIAALPLLVFGCSSSSGTSQPPPVAAGGGGGTVGNIAGSAGTSGASGGSTQCQSGLAVCAGACINTQTDPKNCGGCGVACGSTQQCVNGACSCSALGATFIACGAACVDDATDEANCGACAKTCAAGTSCQAAMCACDAPLAACPSGCVNEQSDAMNCGMCGNACPATTPFCSAGMCSATCAFTACPGGACVNTMGNDPLNCGACGKACAAGQACTAGVCGCPAGATTCGTACVNTMTDPANCGMCGKSCNGQACNAGVCGCAAGQTACPAGSGVCKDLMSDNANCGACGAPCAAGQACSAGKCSMGGSRPTECPAAAGLLSDFEEGSGVLVPQEQRTGWWYVFADTMAGSQTPPAVNNAPIAVAPVPAGEQAMCNKYALHSSAANHPQYSGFGATMIPTGPNPNQKSPVDLARGTYTGLSFKIRSESGTTPVWFEFLNRETQPGAGCTACGVDLGGTATDNAIDAFNTRGRLMNGTGASSIWQIPTTSPGKVITVPFATLGPRYLPSDCAGTVMCEAPAFNPASVLGIQFSIYDQFTTAGGYNLWVDDVKLVSGDTGLPTLTQTAGAAHPFPRDAAIGTCAKPTGASGKYLVEAYQNWKSTFVVADGNNQRVKRPENNNDSVSEGIAYGMLIAVYMNDQALFDGLFGFWKSHPAAGPANAPLMDWKAGSGNGSAVDADEDAAFALIQASKQWSGGSYAADGLALVKAIYSNEVEAGTLAIKPGNNFGGNSLTNPSYFAPAYYRVFATVDSGDNWNGVITKTYSMLKAIQGSNGVVPAWCQNGCTTAGANGMYTDDTRYQYDSHRTPWRIGLDACWNGNADAQNYVKLITGFFATQAANGMGRVVDIYQTNGTPLTGAKFNSMSIIGTAGAGALYSAGSTAAHKQFLDRAWRFLLDASYTADPTFRAGVTGAYTYYNATVGLLTALTLSGNFNNF